MQDNDYAITRLGEMIKGEIAAIETCVQAIRAAERAPEQPALKALRDHHIEATNCLRQQVAVLGGKAPTDSGTWGRVAKAVEGVATALGRQTALLGLLQGEELGLRQYRRALGDERLPPSVRELIGRDLIQRQETHIDALQRLRTDMIV